MIFSVWNQGAKSFDYYETKDVGPTHAPPAHHAPTGGLGATPDEAAWPLPAGARKVGSGIVARGRIASLGSFGTARPILIVGGLLLAAAIARKVLR